MQKLFAVPAELRALRQWILWNYVDVGGKKPTKVPYSISGVKADVNDPYSWASFDEVFNAVSLGGYSGIGFVFTNNDPYTFIDLDDTDGDVAAYERQLKVFKEFDSYSEISPSGKGLHIIVKGKVPQGRRRNFIEVYSSQRYATMTGNVYHNNLICDRQQLLDQLFAQMGGPPTTHIYTGNDPQKEDDEVIIERARNAVNGEKFAALNDGNWQGLYPTQSEADFAYIDIIAFYTQNREQITRIFRASKLMRPKVNTNKGYLPKMINDSFDRLTPPIDFDGFRIALEEKLAQNDIEADSPSQVKATDFDSVITGSNPVSAANASIAQRLEPTPHKSLDTGSNPVASTILPPPGLMGEIANFIYSVAPRPVPEIAIAASIGLMAGICGKAYNVSDTGLNHYVLLLADTGSGKESAKSGIDKIMNAVQLQVPIAREFIGPSHIQSGQALIKALAKNPCFVSILGEFGIRMQRMSNPNMISAESKLKEMLLDLYNKSAAFQVLDATIYSDVEKNIAAVSAPALSIFGESVPSEFYSALTEDSIGGGLLPRFIIIEYDGKRVSRNPNHSKIKPDDNFISRVADLVAHSKSIIANRQVVNVNLTDDALAFTDSIDKKADDYINSSDKQVIKHLWNRAHIKVLKLAALVAVGVNPFHPVIELDYAKWAHSIIKNDIDALSKKFESGMIGKSSEELKQQYELIRMIRLYVKSNFETIKSYAPMQSLYEARIIPYSYLNKRLANNMAFKQDKIGATASIKRAIQTLVDTDFIKEMNKKDMVEKFSTTQKAYMISNMSLLLDNQ